MAKIRPDCREPQGCIRAFGGTPSVDSVNVHRVCTIRVLDDDLSCSWE